MSQRRTPPFRADHVGSFLRPRYLLGARDKFGREEISPVELRKVEDRAITEVVKMQEDAGLRHAPSLRRLAAAATIVGLNGGGRRERV